MIKKFVAASAVAGATAAPLAFTPSAYAAEMHVGHRTCSVHTLRGAYSGNIGGTSSTGPFNLQATTVFHGDGTANGNNITLANESGVTTFTSTNTYTLGDDCTGTLTAVRTTGVTAHYVIAVTDGGAKIAWLQTDPGTVANGTFDRVSGTADDAQLPW